MKHEWDVIRSTWKLQQNEVLKKPLEIGFLETTSLQRFTTDLVIIKFLVGSVEEKHIVPQEVVWVEGGYVQVFILKITESAVEILLPGCNKPILIPTKNRKDIFIRIQTAS